MTGKLQAEYALFDILLHNLLSILKELVDACLITDKHAASIAGIGMDRWTEFTFERQLSTEEVVKLAKSGTRSINTMLFNVKQLKHQLAREK